MTLSSKPTAESMATSPEELMFGSTVGTPSLFDICVFNSGLDVLKIYLENTQVQQWKLDRCLLFGLQIFQKRAWEMAHVTAALKLLVQFKAKWKCGTLLDQQMTPCHAICQPRDDYHELLDFLISVCGPTLLNSYDMNKCTALMYAVRYANAECVRLLIANGADVNIGNGNDMRSLSCSRMAEVLLTPLIDTLRWFKTSSNMSEIFDLLLENGVDVNKKCWGTPITYADQLGNVDCVKRLILKKALFSPRYGCPDGPWETITNSESVDLLQLVFDHCIDKNAIDSFGSKALVYLIQGHKIKLIRFLLERGVTVCTKIPKYNYSTCSKCSSPLLVIDMAGYKEGADASIIAVACNEVNIIQTMEKHGCLAFKSLHVLRCAMKSGSVDTVKYLLGKYNYPLNIQYKMTNDHRARLDVFHTLLQESCYSESVEIPLLLLKHGTDPNIKFCSKETSNALTIAIEKRHVHLLARFIRGGVDLNYRSYDLLMRGNVLPFEASIKHDNLCAAKMLLTCGCPCGAYSLKGSHKFKRDIPPRFESLMKDWNVSENCVLPLLQQCRAVVLRHLSPKTEKITELPLPELLIKYLGIPELDDILDECTELPPPWFDDISVMRRAADGRVFTLYRT